MIVGYVRTSILEQRASIEPQHRDAIATGYKAKVFREQLSSIAPLLQLEAIMERGQSSEMRWE